MAHDGYLLDTSVASWAWNEDSRHHQYARERLAQLSYDLIFVSPFTLAEIEYGLQISTNMDAERRRAIRAAMGSYHQSLPIDKYTSEAYAAIRAALFQRFASRDLRQRFKTKRVEDLVDRTTGQALGIQENDLWIVSVAVQYDLRFVTGDRNTGMRRVLEAAQYTQSTEFWNPS